MSTFKVEVVEIGKVGTHPNADTLSITHVQAHPVIIRTGDLKPGDKAVYVPVDAIVPITDQRFSFLDKPRIKAKRLRGVFSMGLLVPADPDMVVGEDVTERLKITKYEEPEPVIFGGECEKDPGMIHYTDIESLRKFPEILKPGEYVYISEKIHGCNARFSVFDGRLYVGSHHTVKKEVTGSIWWEAAKKYQLVEKLGRYPDYVFFGEVFGQVQDLKYECGQNERKLAFFDIFDKKAGVYLCRHNFFKIINELGLPAVPQLYDGEWNPDLKMLADQNSVIAPKQIMEGIVIHPATERFSFEMNGRVVLKYVSENYLTRKGGTEAH